MTFVASKYQQDIFNWITNGTGDAFIDAVAGSGKTTTLVESAKLVHSTRAIFLAFNKTVVNTLESRLAGTTFKAKTINGLGHGALMKELGNQLRLDANKYGNLAKQLLEFKVLPNGVDKGTYRSVLLQLISFAMSSLVDPRDVIAMQEMAERIGIEMTEKGIDPFTVINEAAQLMELGEKLAREQKLISFDDQIWLPVRWGLKPYQSDFIFVDEAQDLSKAKLELILSARSRGGRIVFVGDPNQAIYGFAGADSESVRNIIARTNAAVFPLSVCYRCPKNVIELAKQIVPHIEARPDAPDGVVSYDVKEAELFQKIREGDLLLCRLTAPLVRTCLSLIARRIPARVKGREIGKKLAQMIRDVAKRQRCNDLDKFGDALDKYMNEQVARLSQKENTEKQIEALQDQADAITIVWEQTSAHDIDGLCAELEELFSDDRASVELSTIHKAKGLEEKRVFILHPEKLPLVWKNQQAWEFEQEMNLKYVAVTRALEELYFVQMTQREGR